MEWTKENNDTLSSFMREFFGRGKCIGILKAIEIIEPIYGEDSTKVYFDLLHEWIEYSHRFDDVLVIEVAVEHLLDSLEGKISSYGNDDIDVRSIFEPIYSSDESYFFNKDVDLVIDELGIDLERTDVRDFEHLDIIYAIIDGSIGKSSFTWYY